MKAIQQLITYFHERTRLSPAEIAHLIRQGFNLGEGTDMPIEALDLSPETADALRWWNRGLITVGQLLIAGGDPEFPSLIDRDRVAEIRDRLLVLGFVDERWLAGCVEDAPQPETDAELLDALAWEEMTQQEHRRRRRICGPRRVRPTSRRAA